MYKRQPQDNPKVELQESFAKAGIPEGWKTFITAGYEDWSIQPSSLDLSLIHISDGEDHLIDWYQLSLLCRHIAAKLHEALRQSYRSKQDALACHVSSCDERRLIGVGDRHWLEPILSLS